MSTKELMVLGCVTASILAIAMVVTETSRITRAVIIKSKN